ncbi:hypothetical protein FALBO_11469 [Fusarium albosuccineum]|uniref:RRM domain-containing protein n=1 Tax=Fusarium albosuccineum TaxID=1237068 RepID=A0A8H4PA24_9HYPO|nr:hypothetical protein FALBO_11469 [Fusarium albosuccineum]
MSRGGTTLYVTGFSHGTRARDLAYEFERSQTCSSSLGLGIGASPSIVVLAPALALSFSHAPTSPALPPPLPSHLRRCVRSSTAQSLFVRVDAEPFKIQRENAHGIPCSKGGSAGDLLDYATLLSSADSSIYSYGRLVRCDIPAPRSTSSRLFAFVEYEDRRDADDAYHEMHNKRIGRDDILKIEWARTPPSASWRFESGRDRDRRGGRSPRRGRSPSPRRSTRDYSPRKDDRRDRDRDYDRDSRRDRDRSRSPDHRDRERDSKDDRDDRDRRENGTNGDERKPLDSPPPAHDDLDVAE